MQYIRQFGIIILFSFIGELLNKLIPLPVPASVYGLITMFLALKLKVLKLDHVQHASEFLLDVMILMFVPPSVGLIDAWPSFKEMLLPAVVIIIVTMVLVMVTAGWITQWLYRLGKRNKR